jgi:hypothetical protein
MQARADTLLQEVRAAEEAARALAAARTRSATDIVVGDGCAQSGIATFDRLNEEVAAEGGTTRVLAIDCYGNGSTATVQLGTAEGTSYVLMFGDEDMDLAERVRPALHASEP